MSHPCFFCSGCSQDLMVYYFADEHNPMDFGVRAPGEWKSWKDSEFKQDCECKRESNSPRDFESHDKYNRMESLVYLGFLNDDGWVLISCKECYDVFVADTARATRSKMLEVLKKFALLPYCSFDRPQYKMSNIATAG